MNNGRIITDFNSFNTNESKEPKIKLDTKVLDALVEIVGSEKAVEKCAKEAFEELKKSFEKNELELNEEAPPEKLAMASLIVKLVESGKLGPEDADKFIEENI